MEAQIELEPPTAIGLSEGGGVTKCLQILKIREVIKRGNYVKNDSFADFPLSKLTQSFLISLGHNLIYKSSHTQALKGP